MNPNEFRIGIVGIGSIAETHARAIREIENAKLVGGCCRTEAKGQAFAKQFECEWYSSYETLIDEARPDVVTICTPSGAHLEPTLYALRRDVHVLCEKPLEINTERIDQMIAVADASGVMFGGIFPQRFNPVVQLVHQAAAQGRFGSLAIASACVPWWRDDDYYAPHRWQGSLALDGGGAMMNQSIHAIDAMQWIATAAGAGRPIEAFGWTSKQGHEQELIEVEDTAGALVRFESGVVANILAATSMFPGSEQRILFGGRDGTAEVHEQQLVKFAFREATLEDEAAMAKFGQAGIAGGSADPKAIDDSNHVRNLNSFLTSIRAGERPSIDGEAARRAVAIIQAIYRSANSGRPELI